MNGASLNYRSEYLLSNSLSEGERAKAPLAHLWERGWGRG